MLATAAADRPLGLQVLGCEARYIQRALDILPDYEFDLLDFNAACPAKKVVRRGEGASLLKDLKKLSKILKLIAKSSKWPLTVKIRIGWDNHSINAREAALCAQDAGADALFIHGRTKVQGYSGAVDYDCLRRVKKALSIPLIASGDALSACLVKKMFDETGADAVSIARGALGNPWIFKEAETLLKEGKARARPKAEEIIEVMAGHLKASVDFYGEKVGVMKFRKFFIWYSKGFRKIRPLRELVSRAKTLAEMEKIMNSLILQGPRKIHERD